MNHAQHRIEAVAHPDPVDRPRIAARQGHDRRAIEALGFDDEGIEFHDGVAGFAPDDEGDDAVATGERTHGTGVAVDDHDKNIRVSTDIEASEVRAME